jgi:hypothetical protein
VHPGYDGWRDDERREAVEFARIARDAGHDLVAWKDIA